MRLIDADALEQELLSIHKRIADTSGADPTCFQTGACVGLETAGQCISKASVIDAVLVKHGRWIEKRKYGYFKDLYEVSYTCNLCGDVVYGKHNYCSDCGAKMDGGE